MTLTGRAAVFVGARKPFEFRDFEVPEPGPRDMVVNVTRANICGSDLHLWRGDTDLARMGVTYGLILGHEMTGTIARLGNKVRGDALGRRLKEGDRVIYTYYLNCGHCRACLRNKPHHCLQSLASPIRPCDMHPHFVGAFADYYYIKGKQSVFKVPDDVPSEVAAGANCALSQVIHGYERVNFSFGETVVIQGVGGLGLYACAVAKEMGAERIVAIDAVPSRLELAKQFGADVTIDMNEIPESRARVQKVMSVLDGWGADVVVELAGVPEAVPEGIRMLGRGGRYLEIGNINPRRTYKQDPSLLVGFNRSIHGVSLYPPDVLWRSLQWLQRAGDRYPLDKLLSHDYALADIDKAFTESDWEAGHATCSRASILPGGHA